MSPGYEPTLSVVTRALGDRVEIRVRDNGTGIPEAARAKIFDPFFTTKPAGEGTGLGLSLSLDIIVKQHGGSFRCRNRAGCVHRIYCDVAARDGRRRCRRRRGGMTATILVVDDEPDLETLVQQRFRRQIRGGEFDFRFARDGVEALDMLTNGTDVDMVLSDINMPRMDGLTLLQKIQESDDPLSTVIVSAYGDMANIRTAMNRGAFDFVTKPIDFADLEATIKKTLAHIERLREARRRQAAAERAHALLSRYFSPNLAERLASDPDAVDLGGQRREITSLFTDIAEFTSLVETLDPEIIAPLLNDYLGGNDRHRLCPWRHRRQARRRRDARAVRGAGRSARSRRARGCLRARARHPRPGVSRALARARDSTRRDPARPRRRPGDRRQFRRRQLLRLHRLWRHGEHVGPARGREQAARYPHLRRRKRGEPRRRVQRKADRRSLAARAQGAVARVRAAVGAKP